MNYKNQQKHEASQRGQDYGDPTVGRDDRPPPQEAMEPSMPNTSRQRTIRVDDSYALSTGLQRGEDGAKNLVKSLLSTTILAVKQIVELCNAHNLWHDDELADYLARWSNNIEICRQSIPREPVPVKPKPQPTKKRKKNA